MSVTHAAALVATVFGLLAPPAPAPSQTSDTYKVQLFAVPRSANQKATIAGSGSATAVLTGGKLSVTGTFEGLRSPATVARLHRGVATGVRGNAFKDLTVTSGTSGTITGTVDLTPFEIQGLRAGQVYIQIHSEKAPDGNLWGWLLR